MKIEVRITDNLRDHLLMDAISPCDQDGLLNPNHREYRESLEELARQLRNPRSHGRSWKVELTPGAAVEMIRQIVGVIGIWETRQAGVNPQWSGSSELSEASKARGAVRAGRNVVARLSDWLEQDVGAQIEWSMGWPKFRLPNEAG